MTPPRKPIRSGRPTTNRDDSGVAARRAALKICQMVLDRGALVADGPPEAVLTQQLIGAVWGVPARWLGEPGARALLPGCVTSDRGP